MQLTYSVNNNLCYINLMGELDECAAPKVRDSLDQILSGLEPMSEVVFDCKNLMFIASK